MAKKKKAKKKDEWTLPAHDSDELAHISPDLRPLARPIESIFPDPDNARLHPERNMAAVMASLNKYGQRINVVVNERNWCTEAGAGRLEAAKALGWKWLAVSREDDDALTAAGFGIADNRTAELATWDYATLGRQLELMAKEGEAIEGLGFTEAEMNSLLEEVEAGGDAIDPNSIGGYDEGQDSYLVKVADVAPAEKEEVLRRLNEVLAEYPHLNAEAY